MKPTLFLLAPSDLEEKNTISQEAVGGGMVRMDVTLSGVMPILPFVLADKTLSANSRSAVLGVHRIQIPSNTPINVFNLVGDADSSPNTLQNLQAAIDKIQPSRCFNLPANVFKTGRAMLPETLAGVPNCIVPRVQAARSSEFSELKALCRKFDRWPLIVRSRGEHGGKQMLLFDDISQLDSHRDLPWLYRDICLIEYIDYKDADGFYQKNRIIVVDGVPYPRHALFMRQWMVHASSRGELMSENMELVHREEQFISSQVQQYYPVFEEMYRRIGLDIFGVDFGVIKGKVLVFEANACMKFLDRQYRADNRFNYLDDHVRTLKRAIKKMLVQA